MQKHSALIGSTSATIALAALVTPLAAFAQVEKVSAFVCPVITSEAVGAHNPQAGALGNTGDYTVVPATANNGNLMVPITATNGNGSGTPGGSHAAPGDTDYTAIWARQ